MSGQVIEGVPTVGAGGRSLSIAAGMLPESTVWSVLERLREMEGSPVLLIERGVGQNLDRYALVPTPVARTGSSAAARASTGQIGAEPGASVAEVESVHPAWSVLGWRHRRLYDTVRAAEEPMTPDRVFTAVAIGRTSGYEVLLDLRMAGLLVVEGGTVRLGEAQLDEIGERYGLTAAVRARIVRHRAERIVWSEWLASREEARTPPEPELSLFTIPDEQVSGWADEEYFAAVLDNGPPDPG